MKNTTLPRHSANRTPESEALETLGTIARVSNGLAKALKGTPYQHIAYDIKALALSSLVVCGVAVPNGNHADSTVGLSFCGSRLHCPPARLTAKARAVVMHKCSGSPTTGPLAERLNPSALASLGNLLRDQAA
jgi:hypothetical protein